MLVALLVGVSVLFVVACVRADRRRPAADDGVVRPPGATTADAVRVAKRQIAGSLALGVMMGVDGDGS